MTRVTYAINFNCLLSPATSLTVWSTEHIAHVQCTGKSAHWLYKAFPVGASVATLAELMVGCVCQGTILHPVIYSFKQHWLLCVPHALTLINSAYAHTVRSCVPRDSPNEERIISIVTINGLGFEMGKNLYRGADKSLARRGRKQTRKHVKDARDFNNIETQAVIRYFFLQDKVPKEIHAILTKTFTSFLLGRAKDLSAPLCIYI